MNQAPITKADAIAAYDGSVLALSEALDITRSAIYQWPDEGAIPEAQELKLRFVLKPEVFGDGA